MSETSGLVKKVPNPTGKGGFGERPETINRHGTWKPENVLSYQYNRFLNMTLADLEEFSQRVKKDKKSVTMAEIGGYTRVLAMRGSLQDAKEIADRTEGKAMQPIEMKAEVHTIDQALE